VEIIGQPPQVIAVGIQRVLAEPALGPEGIKKAVDERIGWCSQKCYPKSGRPSSAFFLQMIDPLLGGIFGARVTAGPTPVSAGLVPPVKVELSHAS
jgi:hypothetical protein